MPCFRSLLSMAAFAALGIAASAQTPIPPTAGQPPQHSPPPVAAVAATVNNVTISELAVFRGLLHAPADKHAELRGEVLNYLVENVLLDEYLDQMKLDVEAKEVNAQFGKIEEEIKASGKTMEDIYKELFITEAEMKAQLRATLRWEKFIQQYATDKAVKDFFDGNKAIFDGSAMRASHILLTVPPGNPPAAEQAKAKIAALKKQIETQVAEQLKAAGKLDNLELQKLRMKLLTETFGAVAAKESACKSKANGGDLGWFPRTGGGRVAEPFAKAAYTLKPWEMSDVVVTEFGYHLILCVDYKAGVERKFEDIRDVVKDVYAGKMREAIIARMKPTAKITINSAQK